MASSHTIPDSSLADATDLYNEEMQDMMFARRGCCFWIPCCGSERSKSGGSKWWQRITTASENNEEGGRWFFKGWKALLKVREWSELAAGPKWKTFIRRFNKSRARHGKFQYDALSYSLNFDEGPGQNGDSEQDDRLFRDFSSRFASIPVSAKSSMDLGKDGPSFT